MPPLQVSAQVIQEHEDFRKFFFELGTVLRLSDRVSPEDSFAKFLEQLDAFLGLDASFLLWQTTEHPGHLGIVASTTKKATPFSCISMDGSSLFGEFNDKPCLPWCNLFRTAHRSAVWEMIWQSMHLGPYSGPWEISVVILGPPASRHGLLVLVAPSPVSRQWTVELEERLEFLATLFFIALQRDEYGREKDKLEAHMHSEVFRRLTAGGHHLMLHGIFSTLQTQMLVLDAAEEELRRNNAKEAQREISDVRAMNERVNRVVRDFLSMTTAGDSIASRRGPLMQSDYVNVREAWERLETQLLPLAEMTGKTFVVRLEEPCRLPLDRKEFDDIASNLIHNAIKYSDKSTKIIVELSHHGRYSHFDVKSYGIPIPDNEREMIFLPGYRTVEAVRREYNAVGLGLAAARRIAERAGGQLYLVASDPVDPARPDGQCRNLFRLRCRR